MSIPITIEDPSDGSGLRIYSEGTIGVVRHDHPSIDDFVFRYMAEYFTSNGSSDMTVDGSASNVAFEIAANADYDRYIKTVELTIQDGSSPAPKDLGGSITGGVTNGISLTWVTQDLGSVTFGTIFRNYDIIRMNLVSGAPAFGTGANAFLIKNATKNNVDAYPGILDLSKVFGGEWGIKLRKGTKDRLCWVVRDDLTSIDVLSAIAYGREI